MIERIKNPILVKEIRTRMRGYRAFLLMTVHLLILSTLIGLIYLFFITSTSSSRSNEDLLVFSKLMFGILIFFELVMITFVAPALSAGSFTVEKERHTYDLLRSTLLSARAIVFGKFNSALTFTFLLFFTSIPMLGPAFIFGGVLDAEIFISIFTLALCAIVFIAIGQFFSSILNRTVLSTVLTYASAIFLTFGVPVLAVSALFLLQAGDRQGLEHLDISTLSVWISFIWIALSFSPLATLVATEYFLIEQNNIWMVKVVLNENVTFQILSPWISHVILYAFLAAGLLWITIQRVKNEVG